MIHFTTMTGRWCLVENENNAKVILKVFFAASKLFLVSFKLRSWKLIKFYQMDLITNEIGIMSSSIK